ncbi:PaaI family thioesterase [Haloechinothrix sp. YIM 98757]|uniref:Acyl-coenzyme A thioesterase THEM4 n=1 Tax=Haloechinothrix aidingensis TaxID=2752311 RepID=A0A838A887_9PSEU|nr:PaaI family thioesterase [Haloechinothrix aidingensis]MBA0124492.1 PaaI family thioesterase [Haloechinothrix aidingensis]
MPHVLLIARRAVGHLGYVSAVRVVSVDGVHSVQQWPPVETQPPQVHPKAPEQGAELTSHYSECFGCGEDQPGGLHMSSTIGAGHVVHSSFTVSAEHQGAPGLAHGGLLSCAFDEALGTVVGQLLRKPAVTGKLETDFRRPVPVGSTLHITAELDGTAGRKVYASARGHLGAPDGPVAVEARALFVVVDLEHFTEHGDQDALKKLRDSAREPERTDRWDINP